MLRDHNTITRCRIHTLLSGSCRYRAAAAATPLRYGQGRAEPHMHTLRCWGNTPLLSLTHRDADEMPLRHIRYAGHNILKMTRYAATPLDMMAIVSLRLHGDDAMSLPPMLLTHLRERYSSSLSLLRRITPAVIDATFTNITPRYVEPLLRQTLIVVSATPYASAPIRRLLRACFRCHIRYVATSHCRYTLR